MNDDQKYQIALFLWIKEIIKNKDNENNINNAHLEIQQITNAVSIEWCQKWIMELYYFNYSFSTSANQETFYKNRQLNEKFNPNIQPFCNCFAVLIKLRKERRYWTDLLLWVYNAVNDILQQIHLL